MPDCTVLNGVTANRIHKSNAVEVVEQANADIEYATRMLLIQGASSSPEDGFAMYGDVTGWVELIEEACVKRLFAQHIIDYPDECEDELEVSRSCRVTRLQKDSGGFCTGCGQENYHKMSCGRAT